MRIYNMTGLIFCWLTPAAILQANVEYTKVPDVRFRIFLLKVLIIGCLMQINISELIGLSYYTNTPNFPLFD